MHRVQASALCRSAAPSLNGIPLLAASRDGTASPENDFLAQLQHSDHTIRSRPSCSRSLISGHETEPWEIVYFKLCKSQILVIEQAMETTALMLGTDKSRGYYLEMICADLENGGSIAGLPATCTAGGSECCAEIGLPV